MAELTCDQVRQMSAELALGIASAQDRAAALLHLQECASCRSEVRELSDIADAFVTLTPPAEPPAGFESRVLASLEERRTPRRLRLPMPGRAVLALAAAAAVVVGVGGWLASDQSSPTPAVASDEVMAAPLISSGRTVGDLFVVTGDEGWMSMWVHTGDGDQSVTCQLRLRAGTFVTVGTFALSHGYGYWAAPLPGKVLPTGAQLIASNRVLAEAGHLRVLGKAKV
jgi:hypothetical protein